MQARVVTSWQRLTARSWGVPVLIFGFFWLLYAATGAWRPSVFNAHVYLANAMLHGHLDLLNPPGHFELVPYYGRFYLNYGVAPAVLMLPLVAIWGLNTNQSLFCAALGAATLAIWWVALRRLPLTGPQRGWMLALFAVGSPFWFDAGKTGWTWPLMHVSTLFGLSIAMAEALGRRRGWLVGIGFGIALSSRQLVVLTAPFFIYLLMVRPFEPTPTPAEGEPPPTWGERLSPVIDFADVVGVFLVLNAAYNWARFHSLTDNGYARFISAKEKLPYGIFNLHYFRERFAVYFTNLPPVEWITWHGRMIPWLDATMDGPNLWISLPAIFLAFCADYHKRVNQLALAAIIVGFCPYLIYYWSGWVQFGCRYFMDVLPFAMILIADGTRRVGLGSLQRAVVLGALVELWGMTWWVYKGWG